MSTNYSVKKLLPVILVLYFYLFLMISGLHRKSKSTCKFHQIYQFGDSIADTGNLVKEIPMASFASLPYGQNFTNSTPTGRCSNGRLMIDYIAMAAGVPLLTPYKSGGNFTYGANFAVAGATALAPEVLAANHSIYSGMGQSSLNVQLDWMSSLFKSVFLNQSERVEKLRSALFIVGEIGGNDYNFGIFQGKPMDALRRMVPDVVDAIINGVKEAISFGATTVMVPGNFPIGCLTLYRAAFQTNTTYDEYQCIETLNKFALYHNEQLQLAIRKLVKEKKTNATIVYGDYYKAYKSLLQIFKSRGSDSEKACCGIGGNYNYDPMRMCGADGVPVCENTDECISWDGIHLTQEAYKIMAASLVRDLCINLRCKGLQGR